jgi:hypothetical protein
MSNYERSNQGPGGIAVLPPTIGSPVSAIEAPASVSAGAACPKGWVTQYSSAYKGGIAGYKQRNQHLHDSGCTIISKSPAGSLWCCNPSVLSGMGMDGTYPLAPARPYMPAISRYPVRRRGLRGLFGLGTDISEITSQPWFPYAMLGALGIGIYLIVKAKRGEGVPTDVLFRNPERSGSGRHGVPEDAPTVVQSMYAMMARSAEANGVSLSSIEWKQAGNTWSLGDAKGDLGHIVMRPKGDHWQAAHKTGMGERSITGKDAADMARDFFEHTGD